MRLICFFIISFCICDLNGQQRPAILLEDMDEHSLDIRCFCKPGVRNKTRSKGLEISYQFLGQGEIRAPNEEFGRPYPEYSKFRRFKTKISLPILRGQRFKSVLSASHNAEQFELDRVVNDFQGLIAATDNLNFKSTRFKLTSAYSINETSYTGGTFSLAYNGSYDNFVTFSNRYAIYSGGIAYGIKKHEDNEWGFGIAGSKNFRNQGFRVLPFVFWNKTINDNWGFQITFPSSYNLRYNIDKETILIANASYNGDSYSFDQVSNASRDIAFNHSEILTLIKLERQIVPWLWLDLQTGYHFNFNSNFELQSSLENLLDIDIGNRAYFKLGIFISPPDEFMN